MLHAAPAMAQQSVDWDKVQIKTTDLGHKTYMLEGLGGNITVAVGTDGIIVVDTQFAPLYDKIKAAIRKISPLPIKYVINTHFHGDHTGGNASFQKDGAIVIAQDNLRLRLVAGGNVNGTSGIAQPRAPEGGVPKETYTGGVKIIEVGGRKAELHHVSNAHTDGDTWVYFPDANVICTGDVMNNRHRYMQVDFANGGDIRGMIRATDEWLKVANDDTKVVVGHGPLANKANVAEYSAMVKEAREKIENLIRMGRTEAEVVAAKPLADLDRTWADSDEAAANFVKQVYNSFPRSVITNIEQATVKPATPLSRPALPSFSSDSQGRRIALVIGNSNYRSVAPLPNPRRDANAVADALRQSGFQSVELAMDLDRDGMVKALRLFRDQADKADWALVYFAGHGIEINGVNYLIPVDAKLIDDRDVQAETVSYEELLRTLGGARALRLIVLDACRVNPFKERMRRTIAMRSPTDRGLARPPEPEPGMLIAYSAKEGEVAADDVDGANSPFARAFVARLGTPGLEVRRLFDTVRDDVLEATGRRQQPFTYQSLPGQKDFYFVSAK
jgi:cyclase